MKETNGCVAKTDLNPEEFKEVSGHIQGAMESTTVPKKRAIAKEPEPAEKRRRREAIASKGACCRKLKSFIDRIRN
eukprot:4522598-Lingulodinium_polyedra.AAC.1